MKSILLLSNSMTLSDWDSAKKILQGTQSQAYILAYDWFCCAEVRALGNKVALLDDYLPQSEWRSINKLATEWGTKWYRQVGLGSKMTWSDIQLGSIVQYPWHYTLNALLRLCYMVTQLIDDKKPEQLELFFRAWQPTSIVPKDKDPLLELVATHVTSQRGLKIINHAKEGALASSFRQHRAVAKNKSRSFLRETQKLLRHLKNLKAKTPSRRNEAQRVLFAQGSHSILEIAQEIPKNSIGQAMWITLGRKVNSLGVMQQDIEASIPLKISSAYRSATRSLTDEYASILDSLAENRFFTSYCVDLFPVIENWIGYLVHTEYPRLALNIETIEKIILEYQPDLVLADNNQLEIERICFLIARKHEIMTLELQHGILNNLNFIGFPEQYITDYNIFWGNLDRDKQIDLKGVPTRFRLGGTGRFDSYFEHLRNVNAVSNKQLRRIGVTCEKLFKFYGPTGVLNCLEATHVEYYRNIIETAKNMPGTVFSFKVRSGYGKHPLLKDLLKEYKIKNYEIVEKVKFEEWFSSLSALITDFSTMGLEAMIFDVPVIILNLTGWLDPVGYESAGAVDVVQSAEELYQALSDNMDNPALRARERAEFVHHALADTDGTAANRIACLIAELLQERKATKI